MPKAVFLDRDGVLNRKASEGQYITAWEQVEFLSGVAEALRELRQAGYLVIVATNQRAVAKNRLALADLESIHRKMQQALAAEGAKIDAFFYCPHDENANCACRKPQPGMLLEAARERRISLSRSWMIGDAPSDVEAGRAAGCRTIWIRRPDFEGSESPRADFTANSLREAAHWILTADPARIESP
jgi:D-glycero-D-manno-heptose 1,7-bisphosphate phosphatase